MTNSDLWTVPRGPMREFGEMMKKDAEEHGVPVFPDLRQASCLTVASDYSGDEPEARFHVYSFLFADLGVTGSSDWYNARLEWRHGSPPVPQRMTYKGLRKRKNQRALLSYLRAADNISGWVATIAVHKGVESIFGPLSREDEAVLQGIKPEVREKMLRILHFQSFLAAGISTEGQDILWYTDEDGIARNDRIFGQFSSAWGPVISRYLGHRLGRLDVSTTARNWRYPLKDQEWLLNWMEDLVAVPDLVAGALSDTFSTIDPKRASASAPMSATLQRSALKPKSGDIVQWYVDDSGAALKRHAWAITPSDAPPRYLIQSVRLWS